MKIKSILKHAQNRFFHRNHFHNRHAYRILLGYVGVKRCHFESSSNSFDNTIAINQSYTVVYDTSFFVDGSGNKIIIGGSCSIGGATITIHGNGCTILIGDGCTLPEDAIINVRGDGIQYKLGEGSHLAGTSYFFAINASILIGRGFLGGRNLVIRTSDRHYLYDQDRKLLNPDAPVTIGEHVWAAMNVSILKGVALAHGTVIATGAVITKSFEEANSIIGGVPARVIRRDVIWEE